MTSELDGELSSFLGEAEELVAGLYETLAAIDPSATPRQSDINALFRATHTLKGLAGMFDLGTMQTLAHSLEDLLGNVRLGRLPWNAHVGEAIAVGVDHLREMVHSLAGGGSDARDVASYLEMVQRLSQADAAAAQKPSLDIGEEVRTTFTEYEEARLIACLKAGQHLFELTFLIKLAEFAVVGKEISDTLEATAEIITKLPAPGSKTGAEQTFLYVVATADGAFESALPEIFGSRFVSCRAVHGDLPATAPAPAPAAAAERFEPEAAADEADVPETSQMAARAAASASVRIELSTLESLTALVGALLAEKARLEDLARRFREKVGDEAPYPELVRTIRDIEKKVAELQRSLMTVRLVPIGQIWSRLRRIVQGYTRASGKRIGLQLEGGDTKLDKVIVEKLADPLIHIIRNAIDHGIEQVAEREEQGKPAEGKVVLQAAPRGTQIVIVVKDDGRGIDWERVAAKAADKGMLKDSKAPAERELVEALFQPGFSTAATVTDLSGRGVGLDVVRKNLQDVNAFIDIKSVRHQGTEFTITVPITLAIFQSLLVEVEGRLFAIPLSSVLENLRLKSDAIQTLEGRTVLSHRGTEIAVVDLGQVVRLRSRPQAGNGHRYFVIVGSAEKRLALIVDAIRGQREIVTKPIGRILSRVPAIAGGALVGEQQLALVLDVGALMAEGLR